VTDIVEHSGGAHPGTLETPKPDPDDARPFEVLDALDAGESVRAVRARFKIGAGTLRKLRADPELAARRETHREALAEHERMRVPYLVAEHLIDTLNVSATARHFGISRPTVYKYLASTGAISAVRELAGLNAALVRLAAQRALAEGVPELLRILTDSESDAVTGKANVAEVLRKLGVGEQSGGGPSIVANVAVATDGGQAIAGEGAQVANLPAPLHEADLPTEALHRLARACLDVETLAVTDPEPDEVKR
jgi:hypothetical protein